jgi:hypothetical protein
LIASGERVNRLLQFVYKREDINVSGVASNEHAQQIFRFQQNRVADASGRRRAEPGEIGLRKI